MARPRQPQAPKHRENGTKPRGRAKTIKCQMHKIVVQTVLVVFENGKRIGEVPTDPNVFYNLDDLRAFCDKFDENIKKAEAEMKKNV